MTVFTYSQARQDFSRVLNLARKEGEVLIKRKDGSIFRIQPDQINTSPLDIQGIKSEATTKDIINCVRESRRR